MDISNQDRRIFTGIAEKASELIDSEHWFNQLSIDAKVEWLYSRVHWSIDVPNLVDVLNHQE